MTRTSRRTALLAAVATVALLAAHALDFRAVPAFTYPAANDRDWGRMLRIVGFAPTWLVIAAALWLEDRRSPTAIAILAAVAAAGLAAEIIKLIVRRGRPDPATLTYVFRRLADHPFNSRDFGFPSSHVMVAFGGAAALANRFRRAAPVFFGIAVGCGLTRLFAGAHFLSDVVAGMIGGLVVGSAVARAIDPARSRT